MAKKEILLFPNELRLLKRMGGQISLARMRRHMSISEMAERTGLSRVTIYNVENGLPSVNIGSYMKVLHILHLDDDILKIAGTDEYGRQIQDFELLPKRRKNEK